MDDQRLFTPRFFVMCSFTFTVFLSAFLLFPTAPFRILDLGGSKLAAGAFLGLLTYASALSAPVTGALADRIGKRRVLVVCSLVLCGFSVAYALSHSYATPLALAVAHGVFWSGLLSASAAYMTDFIPEHRRAEGISYWGMSTMLAIAAAPSLGLWLYGRWGWAAVCSVAAALNLGMAGIAMRLEESAVACHPARLTARDLVEWRVLIVSFSLFLYSFGYGGITSFVALYADENGVTPRGLYFTTFALIVLVTRPFTGRIGDRIGHRRVFLVCLVCVAVGIGLLAVGGTRPWQIASALLFGLGLGAAYPVYAAYVIRHVPPRRRGAAFGSILAGFDTGIGTGSIAMGALIEAWGFQAAFAAAAALAALSLPYFLFSEKRFLLQAPAVEA